MMCESQQKCECEVCIRGRRLKSVAGKLNEDDAKWLLEMGAEFAHRSMDRDYCQAIMDGSWPSAVEILERALEQARQTERR